MIKVDMRPRVSVVVAMAMIACARPAGVTPGPATVPAPSTPSTPNAMNELVPVPSQLAAAKPESAAAIPGRPEVNVEALRFVDAGHRLIASQGGYLIAIDPRAHAHLADAHLASERIPNPNHGLYNAENLDWQIDSAVWAWDDAARGLVGVVSLASTGQALTGLAVWRPGSGALPVAIPAVKGARNCAPLAISRDARLFVARVDDEISGWNCRGEAVQVFELATRKPLGAPIKIGDASTAVFSPDDRYLAIGTNGNGAVLHDLKTRTFARSPSTDKVQSIALSTSPPTLLWTNSREQMFRWQPGRDIAAVGAAQHVALSPDGRTLIAMCGSTIVRLDPITFEPIGAPLWGPSYGNITASAFSDDSRQVAVVVNNSDIFTWQLAASDPATEPAPYTDAGWFAALHRLPPPPPPLAPPIGHDGAFDGRVTFEGKPLANAIVTLTPSVSEYPDARALPPLTAHTGADGRYRFAHVPAIVWTASIVAPETIYLYWELDMRKTKVQHGNAPLQRGVTIRGVVRGPDQRPAAGVHVYHPRSNVDSSQITTNEVDVTTNAAGEFVIDHLPPYAGMTYWITARRADGAVRTTKIDRSQPGSQTVALTLASPDDPNVVHVRVVDHAGAPVAGAIVSIDDRASKVDAQGVTSLDYDAAASTTPNLRLSASTGPYTPVGVADITVPHREPVTITIDH
jgi:hypothetical protein